MAGRILLSGFGLTFLDSSESILGFPENVIVIWILLECIETQWAAQSQHPVLITNVGKTTATGPVSAYDAGII
jgi:hypothetical protein